MTGKDSKDLRNAGRYPEKVYDCYSQREYSVREVRYIGSSKFYRTQDGNLISANSCVQVL